MRELNRLRKYERHWSSNSGVHLNIISGLIYKFKIKFFPHIIFLLLTFISNLSSFRLYNVKYSALYCAPSSALKRILWGEIGSNIVLHFSIILYLLLVIITKFHEYLVRRVSFSNAVIFYEGILNERWSFYSFCPFLSVLLCCVLIVKFYQVMSIV